MRRLLAFVAATGFAGLAMAAPFADMTPDMEYVSPEEMASAIAAAATNQAASASAVAVAATNHTDAVGAAVAQAATNHADAVGVAVAQAATNHTDAVGAAVAVAATNHADAVGAAVAQAATNHADAVGVAVAASVPGTVSNLVTKGFVEDLGIEAGTDGATVTNIVREMGVPMTNGFLRVAPVASVNGKTGVVVLAAADVGAISTSGGSVNGTLTVRHLHVADGVGRTEYDHNMIRAYVPRANYYVTWFFPASGGIFSRLEDLAPEFDPAVQYQVGDLVVYSDYCQLFRCTVAHLGEWDDGHFAGVTVVDAIPNAVSNTVTRTFIEDLGISGGLPPGIDVESLERAVQVGEDLHLIDAHQEGWVVVVSNIVEVGDAHIPGTLFVGGRIFGAPTGPEGRVDIDGCDFFYNRQIPGDATSTNGYGNIVTDPYMEWRLARFFDEYNLETTRMWNQVATINNLPDTLDDDLRTYNSVTSNLEAATMEVNLVRDEVNMTNAVMRAAFDRALAEAASSGEGWSATNATDECLILTDHGVTTCSAAASSYYIMLPSWTGPPAHCLAWFDNAGDWSDSPPSFYMSSAGAVYVDEALPAEFHAGGGKYLFDFRQLDEDTWFLSVHPAGVGSLGGNAR